ncbi:protein rolling stone isoform X3 [Rhagoletis pomonella]|uniref:protein rolling stone isoform X3 n=1 Tax=Rhagoletis pomonella TaxID=28610 RepID=UPI0017823AD1|nr:protein rolling stone isoform X3 [Rhagoletis pomonella]
MSRLRVIVHPVKKEFRRDKCGFHHTPADDFVKSQWQSRTKSVAYLIYRWLIALFFIAVVIDSMLEKEEGSSTNFWLYFIYLTNWGVMFCMLTNVMGAILVTTWHFHPEYAAAESSLNATNVLTHAFNSIFMFIDLLIVAHPLRLLHMFLPVTFGLIFAIFSVIYQKCGGKNRRGKPYIYHVIDWREPISATLVVIGVLLFTCFIYMVLFTIYKLRTLLYRRINNASYYLPTTTPNASSFSIEKSANGTLPKTVKGNGIQHSPSGISMVLGNFNRAAGYQNQAFTSSSEKPDKL